MALTMVVTGVGALSSGAMLGIVNSATRSSGHFQDSANSYYTAAGGIESVMADLLEGQDALETGDTPYQPSCVQLNDFEARISVTPPQVDQPPKAVYRYIDPGASQGLAPLAAGAVWEVALNGVESPSTLFVNWAYFMTGDAPSLEIRVLDANQEEIASGGQPPEEGMPATLTTLLGSGDTYTVEFANQDSVSVLSRAFSARGGQERTWMFFKSVGREHLITSTTTGGRGRLSLRAYVRQIPGPASRLLKNSRRNCPEKGVTEIK